MANDNPPGEVRNIEVAKIIRVLGFDLSDGNGWVPFVGEVDGTVVNIILNPDGTFIIEAP